MNDLFQTLGNRLARFLSRPRPHYERFAVLSQKQLSQPPLPGDLLLVEGNNRISTAIKYLTQPTWSHISFFVGTAENGKGYLAEADLVEGVIRLQLERYAGYNVRICRPARLSDQDRQLTIEYMVDRIGYQYDTRDIVDLMRYFLPTPPIPTNYRRNLIALGSGDPTRAICSTLLAQAFQSVRYPTLPQEVRVCRGDAPAQCDDVLLESRHYSHSTPRDLDFSPYFEIVKPSIAGQFDYKKIRWIDDSPAFPRRTAVTDTHGLSASHTAGE